MENKVQALKDFFTLKPRARDKRLKFRKAHHNRAANRVTVRHTVEVPKGNVVVP